LVPIIVSAHDERFIGDGDMFSTKPQAVVTAFKKKMSNMNGMKAYSIVIPPGDTDCWRQYHDLFGMGLDGNTGNSLSHFAEITGGKTISICQNDYAKSLANISQDLRQKVSSIQLKHIPFGKSLQISFTPAASGISWVVSGTTVTFDHDLPPGTTLAISYLYSP